MKERGARAPGPRAPRALSNETLTHHQPHGGCARPSRDSGDFRPHLNKEPEHLARSQDSGRDAACSGSSSRIPSTTWHGFALLHERIGSIKKTHADGLEQALDTGPHAILRLLARSSVSASRQRTLWVPESLSRKLRDRRAVARYAGLAGSPDDRAGIKKICVSGSMEPDVETRVVAELR